MYNIQRYSDEDMVSLSLQAIKEHNVTSINEMCMYTPFTRILFYKRKINHNKEEYKKILDALDEVKIALKFSLKKKWYNSSNPTLQIACFKLHADADELKALNSQHVDHTTQGEKITTITVKPPVIEEEENDEIEEHNADEMEPQEDKGI